MLFLSIQKQSLEESVLNQEKLESSIKVLMEEKEELALVVLLQLFFSSFDRDSSLYKHFFRINSFPCIPLILQQLTNSLLETEEERAIWSAKEKDVLLAIEEQATSNNVQITSLSTELSEVRFMALLFIKPCLIYFIVLYILFHTCGSLKLQDLFSL